MLNKLPLALKLEDKQRSTPQTKDVMRHLSASFFFPLNYYLNMQRHVPLNFVGDTAPSAN